MATFYNSNEAVLTFVQFAIDVLGKFLRGLYVGRVDVQSSAVGPAGISQLHWVFTHIQDVSPEILHLRVLHQIKLAHGHANGKAWEGQTTSLSLFLKWIPKYNQFKAKRLTNLSVEDFFLSVANWFNDLQKGLEESEVTQSAGLIVELLSLRFLRGAQAMCSNGIFFHTTFMLRPDQREEKTPSICAK